MQAPKGTNLAGCVGRSHGLNTPLTPPLWLLGVQVRRRRAEVEQRLEEVAREASGVRLQLRRLGA